MRPWAAIAVLLAGCNAILGVSDVHLGKDASVDAAQIDAAGGGADASPIDASGAIDARVDARAIVDARAPDARAPDAMCSCPLYYGQLTCDDPFNPGCWCYCMVPAQCGTGKIKATCP